MAYLGRRPRLDFRDDLPMRGGHALTAFEVTPTSVPILKFA